MNHSYRWALPSLVFVSVLMANPGQSVAQTTKTSGQNTVVIETANVSSIRDIQVPARLRGFIEKMNVEEGDYVEKNQVIAELDPQSIDGEVKSAELRYEVAKRQAHDETPIAYAQATFEHAKKEYEIELRLWERDATSKAELERAKLAMKQAELQVARSKEQQNIDKGSMDIEEQAVKSISMLKSRHDIKAQFAGQVMSIQRKEGESIQEGQTILRLVDLSQVKVKGTVNSSAFNSFALKGKPVTVTLQLAGGETRNFDGHVKRIALDYMPSGDRSSDFVVEAIVNNQKINDEWLLHPGAPTSMKIHLNQQATVANN